MAAMVSWKRLVLEEKNTGAELRTHSRPGISQYVIKELACSSAQGAMATLVP